ncbi:hypothetical protein OH77DRAFT_1459755 [Trametes cingulata]|nr:hypothetical protein OH77DRAFT_1459755 [Trametes cingulata]
MRVKVESVAPLPHVKAWFSANAVPTIFDLKTALCADLVPLSQDRIRPQDVLLLLDDFELLDSSPIDVVRDGDLVVIKKKPTPPPPKRKAPVQDADSPARKRAKTTNGNAVSRASLAPPKARASSKAQPRRSDSTSESSSESDSDDESTSSQSESDSDSSTESDSSSSSSSSSSSTSSTSSSSSTSSAPSVRKSRAKSSDGAVKAVFAKAKQSQPAKPLGPPVPPGLGKPATHSRNLRRRRKKMYERLALTAEPASVNEIPLGARAHTLEPARTGSASTEPQTQAQEQARPREKDAEQQAQGETPAFMMASLQNKNKRRGFKNMLSQGVPPKIVFPDASQAAAGSSSEQPSMDVDPDARIVEAVLEVQPTPQRVQPRLVPPSEKQELGQIPANMFVTSVDVEEGMWPAKGKNKKKKKKKQAQVEQEAWEYEQEDSFAGGLPYDDVEVIQPSAVEVGGHGAAAAEGSTEHAVVAAKWDTLRKITDKEQVQPGATVAWKALGINFATLTPEMLLHVGRVIRADENLVVEPFAEPGSAEVSFGGAVLAEEGGAVEETFEWTDVLQGDWRLVSAR